MAIELPQQQRIGLGGSSVAPRDTYSAPGLDQGALRNAEALAKSLEAFGDSAFGLAQQQAAKKKEEQSALVAHYVSQVQQTLGTGEVSQAQIGAAMPDVLPSVRALVAEEIGRQNGIQYASAQFEEFSKNVDTVYDGEAAEQHFLGLKSWAAQQNKDPFYNAGVAKAVDAQIAQFRQQFQAKRLAQIEKEQENGIKADYDAAFNTGITGKPPSVIANSPTAQRLTTANPEGLNTPNKFATAYLGQTEARNSQTLSAFIRRFTGKNIDVQNTPWCAAFVDAVLGQAGKPQLGSLRAADFLRYGAQTNKPQEGDIVVLRPQAKGASGHVGFYAGTDEKGRVLVLAGNQGNKVSVVPYSAGQVVSYRSVPNVEQVKKGLTVGGDAEDYIALVNAQDEEKKIKIRQNASFFSESANIPVTNTNLALADKFGAETAAKIIKAQDTAKIRDVAPEAKAILGDDNVTVSQVRQMAMEQAGVPVDSGTATQNAFRTVDQKWGAASSLANARRRDIAVDYAIDKAQALADPRYLDHIPAEWASVPGVSAKIEAARQSVSAEQIRRFKQQREMEHAQREDAVFDMQTKFLEEGGNGNPMDPKYYVNGKPNPEFVRWARTEQIAPKVDQIASINTASVIEQEIVSYGSTGDATAIKNRYGIEGGAGFEKRLRAAIMADPNLNADQKAELTQNISKNLQQGTVLQNSIVKGAYETIVGNAINTTLRGPFGALFAMDSNGGISATMERMFNVKVLADVKAWQARNPSGTITSDVLNEIAYTAADRVKQEFDRTYERVSKQASTQEGSFNTGMGPRQAQPQSNVGGVSWSIKIKP